MASKHTVIELWPVLKEDLEKFISNRPGWLVNALEQAHHKKGSRGWKDVETIINILQFLKDIEIEY